MLAFTLIELLVVISIIGLLAGLLLPAIQAARESGRRVTCVNNQRNIATALLQFESSAGAFPGWRNKVKINGNDAPVSWVTKILVQLEEADLYQAILNGTASSSSQVVPKIPVLRCPSAATSDKPSRINYVVNGGAADDFWNQSGEPVTYDANSYNGVFLDMHTYQNLMTSIEDINKLDGTSRTLLLSENLNAGFWISNNFSTSNCNNNGDTGSPDTAEGAVAFCWGKGYAGGNYIADAVPIYSPFARTCDLNGAADSHTNLRLPRWINLCTNATFTDSDWYQSARPSSNHPSVIVAAFCDGHVQTINESIEEVIFVQLMTGSDKKSEAKDFIGTAPPPSLSEL
jgi:prepilin-type N-terminal cleavage/methylation domain-containing protein/prepilin-type processing-associated H-X9-DG protein